jgi:frataxin-like iron-binding protein CyaY
MKLFIKKFAVITTLVLFFHTMHAQSIKTIEGSIDALKNETSINIEFTYNDMSVGKYEHESEYIDKKKAEYNTKASGKGDEWAKSWISDRKLVFQPKFIDLFEKSTEMTVKANAKYTIIFHTTTTEPGYNVYVSRKNAEIDAIATIVETADRTKVIAVIAVKNAPGRTFGGNDYATGDRLAECYAVAGKKLGKFLK